MEIGRDEVAEQVLGDIIADGAAVELYMNEDYDGHFEEHGDEEVGYGDPMEEITHDYDGPMEEETHDDGSGDRIPVEEGHRDDSSDDGMEEGGVAKSSEVYVLIKPVVTS